MSVEQRVPASFAPLGAAEVGPPGLCRPGGRLPRSSGGPGYDVWLNNTGESGEAANRVIDATETTAFVAIPPLPGGVYI